MSIIEQVINNYDSLNETDKQIWLYVSENQESVVSMSIDDLAQATNVSRTTISRFVKKLGMTGYTEFKYSLKDYSKKGNNILKTDYSRIFEVLTRYIDSLKDSVFDEAIEILLNADRVFIYASGNMQKSVSSEFKRMMARYQTLVYEIDSDKLDPNLYNIFSEKDAVVFISLSGNKSSVVDLAKQLSLKGVKIITITNLHNNRLIEVSDTSLFVITPEIYIKKNQEPHIVTSLFFIFIEILIINYAVKKFKIR